MQIVEIMSRVIGSAGTRGGAGSGCVQPSPINPCRGKRRICLGALGLDLGHGGVVDVVLVIDGCVHTGTVLGRAANGFLGITARRVVGGSALCDQKIDVVPRGEDGIGGSAPAVRGQISGMGPLGGEPVVSRGAVGLDRGEGGVGLPDLLHATPAIDPATLAGHVSPAAAGALNRVGHGGIVTDRTPDHAVHTSGVVEDDQDVRLDLGVADPVDFRVADGGVGVEGRDPPSPRRGQGEGED